MLRAAHIANDFQTDVRPSITCFDHRCTTSHAIRRRAARCRRRDVGFRKCAFSHRFEKRRSDERRLATTLCKYTTVYAARDRVRQLTTTSSDRTTSTASNRSNASGEREEHSAAPTAVFAPSRLASPRLDSPRHAAPRRAGPGRVKRVASGRTKRQVTSRQTGRRAMRVVATVSAGLGRARRRSVASAAVAARGGASSVSVTSYN